MKAYLTKEGGQIAVSPLSVHLSPCLPDGKIDYLIVFWLFFFLPSLCSFYQVFDATNTTRERRDLILAFVKENAFKVSLAKFIIFLLFYSFSPFGL